MSAPSPPPTEAREASLPTVRPSAAPEGLHRLIDTSLASLLLVLAAPVLLIAAIAVRLDSEGPALFRQPRVGRDGRTFQLLKLRTMRVDADPDVHRRHVRRLISGRDRDRAWMPLCDDPRVTRVGRFLRRTALDELPQLINVLKGDMSLVGPRPATPYEVEMWTDRHMQRLAVRPGITGLWQVEGRGEASFDDMVDLDIAYIADRSPLLDLEILARTPGAVLGARRRP